MQTHKIFQVMTPDAMQHGTKTRYDHDHFKCNQTAQHAHNPLMSQTLSTGRRKPGMWGR